MQVRFGSYIFFSAVVHTVVFMAVTQAGRDAAHRIPEKYVAVTLLERVTGEERTGEASGQKRPERILREALPAPPVVSPSAPPVISPPVVSRSDEASPVSEPKEAARMEMPEEKKAASDAGPAIDIQAGKTGPASAFTWLGPAGQFSTGTMYDTPVNGKTGDGSASNGRVDPRIEAVRIAIEKAKSYPPLARMRGIEGVVTIEFMISANGTPENIRIVNSSGAKILDNAAKKTLLQASPLPPIKGTLEVPITFRIDR